MVYFTVLLQLQLSHLFAFIKVHFWASLVVQWLWIHLAMQGTPARFLVWEDPTCHRTTKPRHHNHWARVPGACALQPGKPLQEGARAPHTGSSPHVLQREKVHAQQQRPSTGKINKQIFFKSSFWHAPYNYLFPFQPNFLTDFVYILSLLSLSHWVLWVSIWFLLLGWCKK